VPLKKVIREPGFLILLAGNAWCIWYFTNNPAGFGNIIWIYWAQSVIVGIFNFIDLLTIKNYNSENFKINDKPITASSKRATAWFFLFHYGMFHFGYMIFLAIRYHSALDGMMILLGAAAFFLQSLMDFRQKKIIESTVKLSLGSIFFLPYLRIVPMHLTILIPAFLGLQPALIFVLLKMCADVVLYLVTRRMYYRSREAN
jgi:hypothetical protein